MVSKIFKRFNNSLMTFGCFYASNFCVSYNNVVFAFIQTDNGVVNIINARITITIISPYVVFEVKYLGNGWVNTMFRSKKVCFG